MSAQSVTSSLQRRQSVHATVIRSCKRCGAPGFWHNTPGINVGCYAPEKVTQLGSDPVGAVCPNCGADREALEDLGEIWSREFRVSVWGAVRGTWKFNKRRFVNRLKRFSQSRKESTWT